MLKHLFVNLHLAVQISTLRWKQISGVNLYSILLTFTHVPVAPFYYTQLL